MGLAAVDNYPLPFSLLSTMVVEIIVENHHTLAI
jgi:hypothetical protein